MSTENNIKNIFAKATQSMTVKIWKNTNFGNNDLVWNVPHPMYNLSNHASKEFGEVNIRFPHLTTRIVLKGDYEPDLPFYDYMTIWDGNAVSYYFINTVIAERGVLIFSVTLDAITTHAILGQPISGTIVRKHDTNRQEKKFDYPTALGFEGNFTDTTYDVITYGASMYKFIESSINLSKVQNSVTIPSDTKESIVVPVLPKPDHVTSYTITSWGSNLIQDTTNALTLYDANSVLPNVLNVVRGLSGDGAISDSYSVPQDAITVTKALAAEVTNVTSLFVTKTSQMKLEVPFSELLYTPRNEAIKGMFRVTIMSMQEKTKMTFPAWDLKDSVDANNFIKVNLWCDPKPSGAPYCCPDQVETLHPYTNSGIISLATLESKSVRGGQWLKNPLVYSTAKGEIFSSIETNMQRERADYEKKVSMHQLELSKRERDIRIAQQDYQYQSGLASSLIGGGMSLLSKDFAGAFNQGKVAYDNTINQQFVGQMRDLQEYEQETEKTLINMAHSNNLKNLNVQESIRRVVPREVVFQPNESLGGYRQYNGFTISVEIPDRDSLISKDMEFSKYGYPTYEAVEGFIMTNHLRKNHTVYQFESPILNIGGKIGDMIREVLQSGIRILSEPYTITNILNNPKL